MRCLTLRQPWASLVAIGAKRIETRSWRTAHRGPLAIHAAKGFPQWAMDIVHDKKDGKPFRDALQAAGIVTLEDLPRGCVIATCRIANVVPTERITDPRCFFNAPPREIALGDYTPGRWGWILQDIEALPEPIPARGYLGLWECDDPRLIGMATEQGATDG